MLRLTCEDGQQWGLDTAVEDDFNCESADGGSLLPRGVSDDGVIQWWDEWHPVIPWRRDTPNDAHLTNEDKSGYDDDEITTITAELKITSKNTEQHRGITCLRVDLKIKESLL